MPDRAGRFTPQEKAFVGAMARSNDPLYAAEKAGYASPAKRAHQTLAKPEIARAILDAQMERLRTEGVTKATAFVCGIFDDPSAPAGAKIQAAKLVFDEVNRPEAENAGEKPLSSLTRAELAQRADQARAILAELDAPVIEHEPATPTGGVFD